MQFFLLSLVVQVASVVVSLPFSYVLLSSLLAQNIFILAIGLFTWHVTVRRLHDIGWSGWWLMLSVLPGFLLSIIVALISAIEALPNNGGFLFLEIAMLGSVFLMLSFFLVLLFKRGTNGENQYGSAPRAERGLIDAFCNR